MYGQPLEFARAVAVVAVAVVMCAVALGASDALRAALRPEEVRQMHAAIDTYWDARQHCWPAELRELRELPPEKAALIGQQRRQSLQYVLGGHLLVQEAMFDAGVALQDSVDAGAMPTGAGYEIVYLGYPDYRADGTAVVSARIWSWSEHTPVCATGLACETYLVSSSCDYSYTFERARGNWKIVAETLLSTSYDGCAGIPDLSM
jgi:hypothetical protein